jgi:hypothetical protein
LAAASDICRLAGIALQAVMSPLFRNRLGGRLALVEDIYHDVARRLVAEVLLSVDDKVAPVGADPRPRDVGA